LNEATSLGELQQIIRSYIFDNDYLQG